MLALLAVALLAVSLAPAPVGSAETPGRPARGEAVNRWDGMTVFLRYESVDSHYVVQLNRRDDKAVIQKKAGGTYYALENEVTNPAVFGAWQDITASAVTNPDDSVTVRLEIDGQTIVEGTDSGIGGSPIRDPGKVGIRGDNTEFWLDDLTITDRSSGATLLRETFDDDDGILTNERAQSPRHPVWETTSGTLYARGGRGYSGIPDGEVPDDLSERTNNSSAFRVITRRDDLDDVAVSFRLKTVGMVAGLPGAPLDDGERMAPPAHRALQLGDDRVRRVDDPSWSSRSARVSRNLFASSNDVVVIADHFREETAAAPALAGARDAPLLVTNTHRLHPAVDEEIRRLGARRAWIVGPTDVDLRGALSDAGVTDVRQLDRGSAIETAAAVAEAIGSEHAFLGTIERWGAIANASGLLATTGDPLLLTHEHGLASATREVLRDLEVTAVTVLAGNLDAAVEDALADLGVRVRRVALRPDAVPRDFADAGVQAGGDPRRVWLTHGSRQGDAIIAGPAAARDGGVHVHVRDSRLDPDDGEIGTWLRAHRHRLDRLWIVGGSDVIPSALVEDVRGEVGRTVPAVWAGLDASTSLWESPREPEHAVIARGDEYADALAGGPLVGSDGALLFTESAEQTRLPSAVRAELSRVLDSGRTVYVLGGEEAVHPGVVSELRDMGYDVRRIGGQDRFETAALVAQEVVARHGAPDEVAIATGRNWPDAVAAGIWAASAGAPVLLSEVGEVPAATAGFLDRHEPAQRWAIGGPVVLTDEVVASLGAQRVAGPDRAATAAAVAEELWGRTSGSDREWFVATTGWGPGTGWGYALALTPLAAHLEAPLLLTTPAAVHDSTRAYVDGLGYDRAHTTARLWLRGQYDTSAPIIDLRALLGQPTPGALPVR